MTLAAGPLGAEGHVTPGLGDPGVDPGRRGRPRGREARAVRVDPHDRGSVVLEVTSAVDGRRPDELGAAVNGLLVVGMLVISSLSHLVFSRPQVRRAQILREVAAPVSFLEVDELAGQHGLAGLAGKRGKRPVVHAGLADGGEGRAHAADGDVLPHAVDPQLAVRLAARHLEALGAPLLRLGRRRGRGRGGLEPGVLQDLVRVQGGWEAPGAGVGVVGGGAAVV